MFCFIKVRLHTVLKIDRHFVKNTGLNTLFVNVYFPGGKSMQPIARNSSVFFLSTSVEQPI